MESMSEQQAEYGETNIVRVRKDARYFVASNIPFNDERLSWEARGVMGYLLSKPDDWQTRMADLINKGPAKMKAIRRILAELRAAGYMSRERVTISHGHFAWITTIYESPELNKSTIYPLRIDGSRLDAQGADIVSTDSLIKKEDTAAVFSFFQANFELLTPFNSQYLGDLIDTYTAAWVLEAMKESAGRNKKSLKYCEAILKGWKADGYKVDTRSKNANPNGYRSGNTTGKDSQPVGAAPTENDAAIAAEVLAEQSALFSM
jgi:DnaD/phage-associated family protein